MVVSPASASRRHPSPAAKSEKGHEVRKKERKKKQNNKKRKKKEEKKEEAPNYNIKKKKKNDEDVQELVPPEPSSESWELNAEPSEPEPGGSFFLFFCLSCLAASLSDLMEKYSMRRSFSAMGPLAPLTKLCARSPTQSGLSCGSLYIFYI